MFNRIDVETVSDCIMLYSLVMYEVVNISLEYFCYLNQTEFLYDFINTIKLFFFQVCI